MEMESGCFKVWKDTNGRKIVYSKGCGVAESHEVQGLTDCIIELSKDWQVEGFAYVAFIEKLKQVSADTSQKYVELHETLSKNQCKYIAYIEGNSYEVSVQADSHKKMSKSEETMDKYFITVDDGLTWLQENGF